MSDILCERTLARALDAAGQRYLPAQRMDGDERYWTKAIVRVRKIGGSECYVVAHRGGDGVVRYVRDFGLMRPIAAVLNIHPYQWVDYDADGWHDDVEVLRERLLGFFNERMSDEARVHGIVGSAPYNAIIRRRGVILGRIAAAGGDELRAWDIDRVITEMDVPHRGARPVLPPEIAKEESSEDVEDVTKERIVVRKTAPAKKRVRGSKTERPRKPRTTPKGAITGKRDGEE